MKVKHLAICAFLILTTGNIFAQVNDSVRTRNDKPGTPQSLRTPNTAPQSYITVPNSKAGVNQTINHTTSEGNSANNTNGTVVIPAPNTNGTAVPKTAITIVNKPLTRADSTNKTAIRNGISNTTNPIRQ